MKHVGETLKAIIENKHMQKNKVAKAIGVTPTYLSTIMHKPTLDCELLERICKAVNASPLVFFDDELSKSYNVNDVKAESFLGAATINISQGEVMSLNKLLEEKERTIQILMKSKGFDPD